MIEMRRCEGDVWEIALSEARESETIMEVLMIDGDGRVNIYVGDSCILFVILWCMVRLNCGVFESRWSCLLNRRS